jgi:hypothetical protein
MHRFAREAVVALAPAAAPAQDAAAKPDGGDGVKLRVSTELITGPTSTRAWAASRPSRSS